MKPVRNQDRSKVRTKARSLTFVKNISDKVWYGVQFEVQDQVKDLILYQVRDQVWNKMR